ncbi:MAG: 2-oxoacid:ferredoxin oxidoreductase subunit gamma [Proteobacteria bacterium]|nr:2-oxoacid:ferredoxin oxidoreductase subunit gamma [Pseudomonadota bacterium]
MSIKQVRLCGFGGQGIVLAGTILGHAAVGDGQWAAGSNAYGSQARGGSARSEVIISDRPIAFPHVIRSDLLITLSQGGYDANISDLADNKAVIIYDERLVQIESLKGVEQIGVPATDIAADEVGDKQAANMVILGAAMNIAEIVSRQSLVAAVQQNSPDPFREMNLNAVEIGWSLGGRIKSSNMSISKILYS